MKHFLNLLVLLSFIYQSSAWANCLNNNVCYVGRPEKLRSSGYRPPPKPPVFLSGTPSDPIIAKRREQFKNGSAGSEESMIGSWTCTGKDALVIRGLFPGSVDTQLHIEASGEEGRLKYVYNADFSSPNVRYFPMIRIGDAEWVTERSLDERVPDPEFCTSTEQSALRLVGEILYIEDSVGWNTNKCEFVDLSGESVQGYRPISKTLSNEIWANQYVFCTRVN